MTKHSSESAAGAGLLALGIVTGAMWLKARAKKGTYEQTGVINNVGKHGLFKKTEELKLQRSQCTSGNEMSMSLYGDADLISKAKDYCEHGTFVKIKYYQRTCPNFFKGQSSRRVTEIEPVEKQNDQVAGPR